MPFTVAELDAIHNEWKASNHSVSFTDNASKDLLKNDTFRKLTAVTLSNGPFAELFLEMDDKTCWAAVVQQMGSVLAILEIGIAIGRAQVEREWLSSEYDYGKDDNAT